MNFEAVKALVDEHLDNQDARQESDNDSASDVTTIDGEVDDNDEDIVINDDDDDEPIDEPDTDEIMMSRSMRSSDTSFFLGTPIRPNSEFVSVLEPDDLTDDDSDYYL